MTFYFYDLETTGFNPREARIMQFAGQRTDENLQPIGEPHDLLIKLTEDVLPDPEAILITGITPQQTLADGLTEAEFLKLFHEEIVTPDTVFVGFNSIRFDDEFMRYLHYRNFYDPYEWEWQDGRSRWDLLDVVRMTRALRPEGINWPLDEKGRPVNRLEMLTAINNLAHEQAHTALSDVRAVIAVAQLIKQKQPKLFDWLMSMRDKKKVAQFVWGSEQFVYTSGKYPAEFEKTTVVTAIAEHPERQGVLVYDLRHDPTEFANMSATELAEAWKRRKNDEGNRLPIKVLQFNRCPAVAPLNVLDPPSQERLQLDMAAIDKHQKQLSLLKDWTKRVLEALKLLEQQRKATYLLDDRPVDELLYEGFFDNTDKNEMGALRMSDPDELSGFVERFRDTRLKALVPLYKARNYPRHVTDEERQTWEQYRTDKLLGGKELSRAARYFARLSELGVRTDLTPHQQYLLEELQLYGQSILPEA
jgi:exodeoxyribonuclease-1